MSEAQAIDTSTPAGAQAQLTKLSGDAEWGARVLAGDVTAKAEFNKLTETASGFTPTAREDAAAKASLAAFNQAALEGRDPVPTALAMRRAAGDAPPTAEELVALSEKASHVRLAEATIADAKTKFEISPAVEREILEGKLQATARPDSGRERHARPSTGRSGLGSPPIGLGSRGDAGELSVFGHSRIRTGAGLMKYRCEFRDMTGAQKFVTVEIDGIELAPVESLRLKGAEESEAVAYAYAVRHG
jgi:hypothetical protein